MRYERLYELLDRVEKEILDTCKYPLAPQPALTQFWKFVTKDVRGRQASQWAEVPQDIVDHFKPILDWYHQSLETVIEK